jgi:stage V sporulation protein SpoVS
MDIFPVLHTLEKLEGGLAELYRDWSRLLVNDPEVSALFDRLAHEEVDHRNLVRYEIRLAFQNPNLFETTIALGPIQQALDRLALARQRVAAPDASLAVRIALQYESDLTEAYCQAGITTTNPGTTRLIQALGEGFRHHADDLKALAVARGWLPPDATIPPAPAG